MELDDCFLCNEPLQSNSSDSDSLRQLYAQTLIRLVNFIHQYSAAGATDGGGCRPRPGLAQSLQGLQKRLQGAKYCKKCTGSLRQLVHTFKSYDNLGKKLEGYRGDWIGRLERSASAPRRRRQTPTRIGGALLTPIVKLRRIEEISSLARYIKIKKDVEVQEPGFLPQEEEVVVKHELEVSPDIDMSPGPLSPPSEDHEHDFDPGSEPEIDQEQELPSPAKRKRSSVASLRQKGRRPRKRKRNVDKPRSRSSRPAIASSKSVKRMARLRQHACDYSGCWHVFETHAELDKHCTSTHATEPRPWTCDQEHAPTSPCAAAFFQRASLLQHIHYIHGTEFKYPCPKCLQGFDEYRPSEQHQKRDHHGGVGVLGNPIARRKRNLTPSHSDTPRLNRMLKPYFPCDFVEDGCEFRGRDEWETQRHVAQEHPKAERPYICTEGEGGCGARFVTEHRLLRHKHWAHSGVKYPCQDCEFKCNNSRTHVRHRLRAHGEEGIPCPHSDCNYKADAPDRLRAHLESSVHTSEPGRHMCQHCGRKFTSSQTLRYHIHSRHPELVDPEELAKYKCPHCSKISASPPILRDHIKDMHEQVYGFHCDKCGAGFRYESRLRRHMAFHLEPHEFEHKCTVCEAKFRHNSALVTHMRRHTGQFKKEHACRHCGKNFTNAGSCRRHERIHAAVLDHVCPICNKGFPIRNYLVIHMRSHETAEQKEARKKGKEKLPELCKVYFETRKKGGEVQVPYPLHYVERGARQNVSRILRPEEVVPSTANKE